MTGSDDVRRCGGKVGEGAVVGMSPRSGRRPWVRPCWRRARLESGTVDRNRRRQGQRDLTGRAGGRG
jgi:hypothetical protein